VTSNTPYAGYHQTGTKNMAARKVLPDAGLPQVWRDRIDAAVAAELERIR
jgi:hypothetical protein